MLLAPSAFSLLSVLSAVAPLQDAAPDQRPFPPSTALEQGVSPETLAELGQLVQGLVDDEEIVGGELMVIKNGHTILHEAYGWSDREAQVPMQVGSVFCVRSMTKPVVGAAIRILVEEDLLELDDPVSKHLESFDTESSREITVEQLLTHTGGLPMSLILGKDLKQLHADGGIRAVADLWQDHEPDFAPGTQFNYSDQGTDTLTALIEVASGMTAAEFVRARVLDPLGMQESTCVMEEGNPLRERALPLYVGSRGEWLRVWSPDDPMMFPFFLGSQGLYSTLEDYARFMEMWRRKGRAPGGRVLQSRSVRKTLELGPHPMRSPTGLPGLSGEYGSLMQLWASDADDEGEREVVAFGHTGSDGTHAWVFPDEKAIVLYFTQSRNNTTGLRVEEVLGDLLLGVPFDANQAAPPFEEYMGYYWEGEGDLYRAIIRDGDDLALEVMGKGVVPLSYIGEDRWKFRPNPSVVLAFDRSESGEVTGYKIGDHQEYRFEPRADLPSVDDVAERVCRAHRMDLIESLGTMHVTAELNMEKLGITGQIDSYYSWPNKYRVDTIAGENFERIAFDGEVVRYDSSTQELAPLEGVRGEDARLDNPFARFGDWRVWFPAPEVVQELQRGGKTIALVRTGDVSAPARNFYVDLESGRVVAQDGLVTIEGMGRLGQRLEFSDFRDLSGVLLPHAIEIELANPLIGSVFTTTTEVQFGAQLPEGGFKLSE